MRELTEVVKAYAPGQGGIDGGGFQVVKTDADYLYTQFESLKYGFIDDVEFAVAESGDVQVRSASRLGYLDFGVNAKRLNYLSSKLRALGWTAPQIDSTTHPSYFTR